MKGRTLIALTVAALLAGIVALWLGQTSRPASLAGGDYFYPGFDQQINEVSTIHLLSSDEASGITLVRKDNRWVVQEKSGHAADAGAIRNLLLKLAEARVLESKTSNPALYPRLGVEDVSGESGSGVLLKIEGPTPPTQLIIGNIETRAGSGTYVRTQGESGSYLINKELQPKRQAQEWLDRQLLDISPEMIRTVTIRHSDGEIVRLLGIDGHLALATIPEGRELSSPAATSPIGRGLENLRLEDVMPAAQFDAGDPLAVVSYQLIDGRLITLRAWQIGNDRYIALELGMAMEDQDPVSGGVAQSDGEQASDAESQTARADVEQVARDSEQLAGWIYRISVPRYEQLVRRSEDLLRPLPDTQ
ncbi:MAG: DUF4340 domain-containing protein [Gammaproteobacteria bacterium]